MARQGVRSKGRQRRVAALSPSNAAREIAAGLALQRAGDAVGAAARFRNALAAEPDNADAVHLLGVAHYQAKDWTTAVSLLRRAVERKPHDAEIRSNFGAALLAAGDHGAAVEAFRAAARIDPRRVETHANLAAALARAGEIEEAMASFETAYRLSPTTPRFARRLAELALSRERYAEAAEWFERYLALAPEDADAHNNAAYSFERLRRLNDAERCYRAALARRPDSPEIANNLGSVLKRLGRVAEADALFDRALAAPAEQWEDIAHRAGLLCNRGRIDEALAIYDALAPQRAGDARLLADHGEALMMADRKVEAETAFRAALAIDPSMIDAQVSLGICLARQDRADEAATVLRAATGQAPYHVKAALALCGAFSSGDRLDEACEAGRRAMRLKDFRPAMFPTPHRAFRAVCAFDDIDTLDITLASLGSAGLDAAMLSSGFLDCLVLADDDEETEHLVALHRHWGETIMAAAAANPLPPADPRSSGRIRLGFLSSDLRSHSVGRFVLPLIEHYDRDRFEVYCYTPHEARGDPVQERIREQVAGFRVVSGLRQRDLAAAIRSDAIDILFELNGFTGESRLKAMAWRPAPVQVYWLGYPFTTGLSAMDYILLDPNVAPTRPDWLVETPLLMPQSWVCYDPLRNVPLPATLPADRNGHITFGSLNNPYKITRAAVALWSRVMNGVPGSRFRYVRRECDSAALRQNLVAEFARHGIAPERLEFENNRASGRSHFDCYGDIDLSFDTMPLTGGTTTIDALWMGVPVVSLSGPGLHQRLSRSLLHTAGLADLCTETPEDFVTRAVTLAGDLQRLRALRSGLRAQLLATPLGDRRLFARQFCDLMESVARRHALR